LVYPAAPAAACAAGWLAAKGSRRTHWIAASIGCALVLARFVWLGVFTAVMF
jgi:hypothetical protein